MYYDNFKTVCARHGTTVTTVLKKIGRSTGLTGKWRGGSCPSMDVVAEMAAHLGVSLDEMATGVVPPPPKLSKDEREWLDIVSRIPPEKQAMCKDFLRTHMTVPEKYDKKGKRLA